MNFDSINYQKIESVMEEHEESANNSAYRQQGLFDKFCGWFCSPCNKKAHADQFSQKSNNESDDELPIEYTNITGTYLQHLNDDCLLEIFGVKSLSLMDLCSLAETCKRFQQISQRLFPKDLSIDFRCNGDGYIASRKFLCSENRSLQDIERILMNFGSFLSVVSISSNFGGCTTQEPSRFVLNLVSECCVENLENLTIHCLRVRAVLTVKSQPIFKRLRTLDLQYVDIDGEETLFADLDFLLELRVWWVNNCKAILKNIFVKLERFTCQTNVRIDNILSTFISRHTNLKTLRLYTDEIDETEKETILKVIGSSCKELEELTFNIGRTKASSFLLQEQESLNILKLYHLMCDDLKFIPVQTKLRELHLNYCDLPKDSNQFAVFSQLAKLHIRATLRYGSVDVLGIIIRLTSLVEFTISGQYSLCGETFSKIVAVVQGRPNVLTLACKFNFVLKSCDDNYKVRLLPLDDRLFSTNSG